MDRPKAKLETQFGAVEVTLTDGRSAYLAFHDLKVNGVHYHGTMYAERTSGGAWRPSPGGGLWVYRNGNLGAANPTPAAYRSIRAALLAAVGGWAADAKRLAEADRVALTAAIEAKSRDILHLKKQVAALEDEREVLVRSLEELKRETR